MITIRDFVSVQKSISLGQSKKVTAFLQERKPDPRSLNYIKLFLLACKVEDEGRRDEMLVAFLENGLPLFFDGQKLLDCEMRFAKEHNQPEAEAEDITGFKTVFEALLIAKVNINVIIKALQLFGLPENQNTFLKVLNLETTPPLCIYKELFRNYCEAEVWQVMQHLNPGHISPVLNMGLRAHCQARSFDDILHRLPLLDLDSEANRVIAELAESIRKHLQIKAKIREEISRDNKDVTAPIRKKKLQVDPVRVREIAQQLAERREAIQKQAELDAAAEQIAKQEAAERKAAKRKAAKQRALEQKEAELRAAEQLLAQQSKAELNIAEEAPGLDVATVAEEITPAQFSEENVTSEIAPAIMPASRLESAIVFGDFFPEEATTSSVPMEVVVETAGLQESSSAEDEVVISRVPANLAQLFSLPQVLPSEVLLEVAGVARWHEHQRQAEAEAHQQAFAQWQQWQVEQRAAAAQYQWQMFLQRRPKYIPPAPPIEQKIQFGSFPAEGTMQEAEEVYLQRFQQKM